MSETWRGKIAELERVATGRGRAQLNAYALEGLRLHERALNAGVELRNVVVSRSFSESVGERESKLRDRLLAAGTDCTIAPDEEVSRYSGGRKIGGVLSLAARPDAPSLGELVWDAAGGGGTLLVGVDVEDPGNVGALVRTALASGASAYIRVGTGDPYHPQAVRTSMGSLFRLPILHLELDALLQQLRGNEVASFGAVSRGGTGINEIALPPGPMAMFVGSEAFGLSEELVSRLDARVTIPMASGVDSYSVNAAAAILLYERRRGQ